MGQVEIGIQLAADHDLNSTWNPSLKLVSPQHSCIHSKKKKKTNAESETTHFLFS